MTDAGGTPAINVAHATVQESSVGTVTDDLNATEQNLAIEVESDRDSAFGGSDQSSTSTSLASSVFDYVYENGRRYHKYHEGSYVLPNDEQEQDRLDMLHHIFRLILGGALYKSPISNPRNVLDIGTGTGIWALDFADENPASDVLGNDLSPIQPSWTAPNCRFIIDDVESPWSYPSAKALDFIHQRNMVGSIGDWHQLYQRAYDNLAPGGWYEAQEFDVWFQGQAEELKEDSYIFQWQTMLDEASSKFGKRLNCVSGMKDAFSKVAFVNVRHDIYKIPIGKWPKDKRLREIGVYLQAQMLDSVEGVSMAYFTRVLGWSKEETLVFVARARQEFKNNQKCVYVFCHFLRGQKPAGPS
ncbi:uncharacterized protein A1O9_00469 [Exophiala aquamarina CBS 119918]|uniref:Methyltransferase n=1 Tax=Exophiala aquamarina CBS 119918 TaxID=1182545 RepID=A0A072PRJ4_9EURO|nr:uncharacterized protein A1O9_00469 [Exophiala aquamarina CBS 119918]KEF62496.1 hypothetical protein A1O9_00469 [Exophiala aquamarina CBS 119918]